MILWYSGTGNSRYTAEHIADITGDEVVSLNDKLRTKDYILASVPDRLVFATPTYAWRIPRIVSDWILKTELPAGIPVWFVMTCGSETGNAAKYNMELCSEKNLRYMGTAQIIMPENFITMFTAPEKDEAEKIITEAEPVIRTVGETIAKGEELPAPRCNLYDRAMSRIVNPVFYSLFVKADGFYAKDSCIGCGKCVSVCPLGNIRMTDGKPSWGKNCTQCMACICRCPAEAIEYGNKAKGKPRYHLG